MKKLLAMILCLMLVLGMGVCAANAEEVAKGEPMHIIFFVGGDAGDSFASIVYKGAMAAAELLEPCNVTVDLCSPAGRRRRWFPSCVRPLQWLRMPSA